MEVLQEMGGRMKIISCEYCGILVDADRIKFPSESDIRLESGAADETKSVWDDFFEDYVPAAWCPVCGKLGLTQGRP